MSMIWTAAFRVCVRESAAFWHPPPCCPHRSMNSPVTRSGPRTRKPTFAVCTGARSSRSWKTIASPKTESPGIRSIRLRFSKPINTIQRSTGNWFPFFHTYDGIAYQNNSPIFQQPNAARYSTVLGREIFVQYVTDYMQTINVTLPAGQWINYWNEQELHAGPTTIPYPVPLGREPIFIANGAIIPMQVRDGSTGHGTTASVGALTVNVFPNGHSTFSYFDSSKWLLFDVKQTGKQVALCTSAPPTQPLIYRIARWPSPPAQVNTLDGAIGVDATWGTPLSPLGSEAAVDASGGGWFYDSARQHLIVKITKVGSYCP